MSPDDLRYKFRKFKKAKTSFYTKKTKVNSAKFINIMIIEKLPNRACPQFQNSRYIYLEKQLHFEILETLM